MAAMCGVVMLLSLAGLSWAVASGQLRTMDGILLTLVCLLMGGIFSLLLVLQALSEGWIKRSGKKSQDAGSDASAGKSK